MDITDFESEINNLDKNKGFAFIQFESRELTLEVTRGLNNRSLKEFGLTFIDQLDEYGFSQSPQGNTEHIKQEGNEESTASS